MLMLNKSIEEQTFVDYKSTGDHTVNQRELQ